MDGHYKALIADDSELGRNMTMMAVCDRFACEEAEDGSIAVRKYQEAVASGAPFDIIFMDVVMPEMDGKTAVRKIREFEELKGLQRTPIYMISASETLDGIEGLADGLLRKPGSRALLNEIIKKHFE